MLAVGAMLLLIANASLAQTEDKPSVWFLTFGTLSGDVIQTGVLDALEVYGFISPEDRSQRRTRLPIESAENSPIHFHRLDADSNIDRLRALVATALTMTRMCL